MRVKNKIISTVLITACLAVFLMGMSGCDFGFNPGNPSFENPPDSGSNPYNVVVYTSNQGSNTDENFSDTVARVRTTCVDVYCSTEDTFAQAGIAGSGVIFAQGANEDANEYYIITNHHVIENQRSFTVTLLFIDAFGNESNDNYPATLLGGSKSRDIAVLRITKKNNEKITPAIFGDSDGVRVGDDVFAIGNPLGILGGTVSKGIISSKARTISLEDIGYMTLFQTDTATYKGSSGGALFNTSGEVIGITNSGYSNYDGLNFAIPSKDAIYAATSLLTTVIKENDGSVSTYGYVVGDSNIGLTVKENTCYASRNSNEVVNVVYLYSHITGSDASSLVSYAEFYNGGVNYFHALRSMSYSGKTIQFTSEAQAISELAKIPAGTDVTFNVSRITYTTVSSGGLFGRSYYKYYLDRNEAINVTVTQYIYSPN